MLFTASLRTTGLPFSTELRRETFRARDVCFKSVFYRCMCAWDNWPVQCISQFYGKLSQEIIKCIRIRISGNESDLLHTIQFFERVAFSGVSEKHSPGLFSCYSLTALFFAVNVEKPKVVKQESYSQLLQLTAQTNIIRAIFILDN